jgi:putative endonuclease
MMFFVYIIESVKTKKWYYGHTNHLELRLSDHNFGRNKSTKNRGPWKYIFQKPMSSLIEAVELEKYLKRMKNKAYVKKKYANYFLGC